MMGKAMARARGGAVSGAGRLVKALMPMLAAVLLPGSAAAQDVVEYYQLDSVGNVLVVTNAQGTVVEERDYLPFGEELCGTVPCSAPTAGQPRRFTGKERDAETGLDYFGARYYRASHGRFTTVDPVYTWRDNLVDPQRWNRYAYGRNNPFRYVDPDGRDTVDLAIGFGQGVGRVAAGAVLAVGAGLESHGAPNPGAWMMMGFEVSQDAQALGYAASSPSAVLEAYVALSTSANGADQRLLGGAIGEGSAVAALTLAPFAKSGAGPYDHIPDGASVGPGKVFTQSQKAQIYEANRLRNGGVLRSDCSGCELVPSQKSVKGVSTPRNAAQVDHNLARSRGGSSSFRNARVLSAEENRTKGAN
jgi:RHS repeat-associated protein